MAVLVVMIMMMVVIIVMVVVVMMAVLMIVILPMRVMVMMVALRLPAVASLDARLVFSASANPAHQSTSSSVIRNSPPPAGCT